MKTILICLAIFVSLNSFGQQIKTDSTKIVEVKNEIKIENLVFKCGGGFLALALTKKDEGFEKKYNIRYEIFGCLRPEEDILIANNIKVVKYLDDKYGKEWRAFARQDIVGLGTLINK